MRNFWLKNVRFEDCNGRVGVPRKYHAKKQSIINKVESPQKVLLQALSGDTYVEETAEQVAKAFSFTKLMEFFEEFEGESEIINSALKFKFENEMRVEGRRLFLYFQNKVQSYKMAFGLSKSTIMAKTLLEVSSLVESVCITTAGELRIFNKAE